MILQHEELNHVADMIDAGEIKTTLDKVFGKINATNLRAAHATIESGKSIGKVVLEGW
jgi:NADPH:quinone reductase-like Zn-dependent oxidoreductase